MTIEEMLKKNVNVRYLKFCFEKRRGLVRYNKLRIEAEHLTKEEYDFLKNLVKEKGIK